MPDGHDVPLLATKLHPPRRSRALVDRRRLRDAIERRGHAALTLVSASAGFGKTTLIVDLLASEPRTAWLSLDPRDDDPVRFWTYVSAALDTVEPELGAGARAVLEAPAPSIDAAVATLLNDLATLAQDVVLVLDDYHVISSREIHESVAFLLDHLPPQVRLVIATRADPPLPLATLRAAGELLEVRAADLRFDADEAASYFNDAMDLALSPDDIGALEARTEGWIAALQLAALSLQGRDDPSGFVAEFAGDDRFILDYLGDEVLERQTPAVRDFLLNTSILSRLSGPLCAAVTGDDDDDDDDDDAKVNLQQLERSNLFLVPLDDRRAWYRYHHLFADVLRARLLDQHPDRLADLHRRASDWYSANGEPHDAIVHAFAANDMARAAELIELAAPLMQRARQESTLRGWLEDLPTGLYAERPVLCVFLVGARMATGDTTGTESLLQIAEARLDGDEPPVVANQEEYARLPAMVAIQRAGLALLTGDAAATVVHANRALELNSDGDLLRRGAATGLLALAAWTGGDLDTAGDRYVASIACFEGSSYLADVFGLSLALADIQIAQSRLHDARQTFEAARRHADEHPGLRGAADMHAGLSLLAVERNDLDAAAWHLEASAELGEHMGLPQHPYRWRVATARLAEARGDLDGALRMLHDAEPLYNTDFSPAVRPVAAMTARLQIRRGDLAAATTWAAEQGLAPDDELNYLREFEHVTLAHLLVARGETEGIEEAISLLGRLLTAALAGHREGSRIEILVALSAAQHASGNDTEAAALLQDALVRAEPEGYTRTFLDAGPGLHEVLETLRGPAGDRAARVLAADVPPPAAPRPMATGPDELSSRELDVLRLLRSDLNGPEIARELHVSLNTLRTHTKHVYTKLGVNNRRTAVTRAAELGL